MSTENSRLPGARDRLIDAAIAILSTDGPGEIKARRLAAAADMSTMMVYSTFGGIPGLMGAVRERGFADLEKIFEQIAYMDDPVASLFAHALACREFARGNAHLYDLMFGLSVRSTYRPVAEPTNLSGKSPAFAEANAHVTALVLRLISAQPGITETATSLAAQLWSFVHGFVSLELAGHFTDVADPVSEVFIPMGVKFVAALGGSVESAWISHRVGRELFERPSFTD